MQPLAGKNILLGISGGIAAYKCAELTRRLIERGANVRVVMTDAAKAFITPLTMQAVSGHPVSDSLLDSSAEASMGHIELAKWADLILLAPATADLIARISAGMGNDLLTTLLLATPAPIAISPAMNQQMYHNIATQENIATLTRRGMMIWGPTSGSQACGDVGLGRMLEPIQLVEHCELFFSSNALPNANALPHKLYLPDASYSKNNLPLHNKSILITAGPTREAIDPVRYITNHSSGKMGYAIAQAAAELGATVTLISGPVQLQSPENIQLINVESAQNMYDAVMSQASQHDVFISCAAVADYRPESIASQKIKKTDDSDQMTISMIKNPDIVASVAALTEYRPFTVGFAAETQDIEQYARSKLMKKNLDMICANDISISGQGFDSDNNALAVYWNGGECTFSIDSKINLAHSLMQLINKQL